MLFSLLCHKIFPQLKAWVFTYNFSEKTGQSELNLSIFMKCINSKCTHTHKRKIKSLVFQITLHCIFLSLIYLQIPFNLFEMWRFIPKPAGIRVPGKQNIIHTKLHEFSQYHTQYSLLLHQYVVIDQTGKCIDVQWYCKHVQNMHLYAT